MPRVRPEDYSEVRPSRSDAGRCLYYNIKGRGSPTCDDAHDVRLTRDNAAQSLLTPLVVCRARVC